MLWEIEGHAVYVEIKDLPEIQVVAWEEGHKSVAVPAGMPQEEALWSIRQLLKSGAKPVQVYFEELPIFGRNYAVKITLKGTQKPYLVGTLIHCSAARVPLSQQAREKLSEALLLQQISQFVGYWEEQLHLLLQDIQIRKFKTKAYTVCLDTQGITFSKNLGHNPLEWINYTVLIAMLTFTNWDMESKNKLIIAHFPLWKIYHKSLAYAYRNSF